MPNLGTVVPFRLVYSTLPSTVGMCNALSHLLSEQQLGTSAAFIGSIHMLSPVVATVQIDNGTPFGMDYGEPSTITPPTYKQWFVTPTLPDGRHRITISNLLGAAVDYAVVKVGNQTSLTGRTVIVDDDSPLIQYYGRWSRNTVKFIPGAPTRNPVVGGYPYGNGTHLSFNPGDSFAFRFSGKQLLVLTVSTGPFQPSVVPGTSIAVYGLFAFNNIGSLTTSCSLDGKIYTNSYTVDASTPEYANGDGEIPNYLYFGLENLSSGTHTFLLNITGVDNKAFVLDYITYKPAFDTLSSIPSLSSSVSDSTSRTSSPSASSTASGSHKSLSTGAVVGSALGGIAFGALVVLLVIYILRRRKPREPNYSYNDANIR